MMLDFFKGGIALFSFTFNLLVALLVLARNPRRSVNVVYFIITLAFSLWALALFFYEFPLIFSGYFWIKIVYSLAIVYLGTSYIFSFIFPVPAFRRAWGFAAVVSLLYYGISFWLLFFTNSWVAGVVIDPAKGQQTILGPLYVWWVASGWGLLFWMIANFILRTRHAVRAQKFQMYFFWIGFVLYGIGVSLLDVILPSVFQDTRFFIYSAFTSLFFTGATAYIILKHRFLDIHLVVARSISYFLLLFSFCVLYALSLFLSATFLIKEPISISTYAIFTVIAIIIAVSFQPLLVFFQKFTDEIFYKQNYNEPDLLYKLALFMASTFNLTELTSGLLEKILAELHISWGAFVLIDNKKIFHLAQKGRAGKLKFSDGDIANFIKQTKIVLFDELPEGQLKEMMRKVGMNIIVPLRAKGETEDVLIFGEKLSGNPYVDKDVSFFQVFSSAAAVAIKNVSNVEQIVRLDELKSEFISVVSHQLRTPLSVARWNFELILDNVFGKLPVKAEQITRDTYQQFVTLTKGLNNLMAVLEIEKEEVLMKYEKTDIDQMIIEEAISNLDREIKEKKIIIKRGKPIAGKFSLDQKKIKTVFEIILDNAIRYSPEGSTITISQVLRRTKGKKEILVSVADEGIGVKPENRGTIFTKFFRGEEAKKMSPDGFGLGLFMAQKYIEYHGGNLWFEKNKAAGSTFSFLVPERIKK
jgi:K+-sensing histidine kinase KdpD